MKSILILFFISLSLNESPINKQFVDYLKKNAPYEVYSVEENPFKDYTKEELKSMLSHTKRPNDPSIKYKSYKVKDTPETYDFRVEFPECVSPVQSLQLCGGLASPVPVLQERFCQKTKGQINIKLSQADLISCHYKSCSGINTAWQYFTSTGVVTAYCFPFYDSVSECISECADGKEWKKYQTANYYKVSYGDLKQEIIDNGPLDSELDVYEDFYNYKSGIYEHYSGEIMGYHSVEIIGFGLEGVLGFWICKNNWGDNWGESGYFRIKTGECGIGFNVVSGTPQI